MSHDHTLTEWVVRKLGLAFDYGQIQVLMLRMYG